MKISVALCTFNGAKYLQGQLDSFAAQTRLPDELVVCDDASTDETKLILENFANSVSFPVRIVVNQHNLGSSKNFEQAIEKCSGDIIALSDQDDVWMPEKLRRFDDVFRAQPDTGLVFSNAILTDENLKPTGWELWDMTFHRRDRRRFREGKVIDVLLEYNVVTGATMAFRSRFRDVIIPFPELTDFIHDGWISLVIAALSRLQFINEPLVRYRQHSNQQIGAGLWKWDMPIKERHNAYIENRRLALKRLPEISEVFRARNLLTSGKITLAELNAKIDERKAHIQKLIEHYKTRAGLPETKFKRLIPIVREVGAGRYHKFSGGFTSAALDLVSDRHISVYLKKAWRTARTDGLDVFYKKARRRIELYWDPQNYRKWIREHDTLSDEDCSDIRARITAFPSKPLISVLMPVYNVDEIWLRKAIGSVHDQLYTNWELCVADDNSTKPHVRKVLEEYAANDRRVKVKFRETNGHISASSNSALELITGEFTALLDHDDELSRHALYLIAEAINSHPDADMIYSDEDMVDMRGRRYDPKFKPDWSPDAFYSVNFTNHLSVYRTSVLKGCGGWRVGFEGSQDYDLTLRVIEKIAADNIRHIPHVLYHWRAVPGSVALASGEKTYAHERARMSLSEHFRRAGIAGLSVKGTNELHRTVYSLPESAPLVSMIVIATDSIVHTVRSILSRTDYVPYEIIILCRLPIKGNIPDDPRVKICEAKNESQYVLLNDAAKMAAGQMLCFIDGSTIVEKTEWLREVVGHALQKPTGAVGAKILYPDRTIKHAGLLLGIKNGVGRAHHHFPASHYGNNMRLSITQNFSAVSAECLTIQKEVFESVGGFDAENFPAVYADVDLCLRLLEKGYRNVWTPWAELIQSSKPAQSEDELRRLRKKWSKYFESDPYYNPNLSNDSDDFSLAFPPRIGKFSL